MVWRALLFPKMKNYIFGAIALFLVAIAGASFTKVTQLLSPNASAALNANAETLELKNLGLETGKNFYQKSFSGAILNAEKDTLALPNFLSNFQVSIATTRTQVSGTHNVKLILDESSYLSGTANWRAIDSTSTTTATMGFVRQPSTYGVRHRIRMVGTGTQSATYTVAVVAKKLN